MPGEITRSSKGATPVKKRTGERWLRRGESEMGEGAENVGQVEEDLKGKNWRGTVRKQRNAWEKTSR